MPLQKVKCPICQQSRAVTRRLILYIRAGRSGRCADCYRAARKLSGKTVDPSLPIRYEPTCQPVKKLDAAQLANKAGIMCRHCSQSKVNRPRGLCWHCFYQPGVKELYPSTSKYARRGVRNFAGAAPLPLFPTNELPGTPEKVAVMLERAKAGYAIFHPHDAKRPESDAPCEDIRPPDPAEYEDCA